MNEDGARMYPIVYFTHPAENQSCNGMYNLNAVNNLGEALSIRYDTFSKIFELPNSTQ